MCGPCIGKFGISQLLLCVVCESQKFPCTWAVFCGVVWIFQLYWRGCPGGIFCQISQCRAHTHRWSLKNFKDSTHHSSEPTHREIFQYSDFSKTNLIFSHRKLPQYMAHTQGVFPIYEDFPKNQSLLVWEFWKTLWRIFVSTTNKYQIFLFYKNWLELLIVSVQFEQIFPGLRPEPQIYTE